MPSGVPAVGPFPLELAGGAGLADQEAAALIAAEGVAKIGGGVPGPARREAPNGAPEHRQAADDIGRPRHPVEGTDGHEGQAGPHEILAGAVAGAAGPPALVARAHRAEVLEAEVRLVPADGDPAVHPAAVAV